MTYPTRRPARPPTEAELVDGYAETLRRLITHFRIDIQWDTLDNDIGQWDGPNRQVTIDRDAPLANQAWFVCQVWQLCTIGPDAVPDAVLSGRGPLRVVR